MARVEVAAEVAGDFDRILDHLAQYGAKDAAARIGEIIKVIGASSSSAGYERG